MKVNLKEIVENLINNIITVNIENVGKKVINSDNIELEKYD